MSTNLQIGIVGLPNVGKSTLFNAITKAGAEAANFPFCTIEPNVGIVEVPDHRIYDLAKMFNPKRLHLLLPVLSILQGSSQGHLKVKALETSSSATSGKPMRSLMSYAALKAGISHMSKVLWILCVIWVLSIQNSAWQILKASKRRKRK